MSSRVILFIKKAYLDTINGLFKCQLCRAEGNLSFNGFLVNNQSRVGRERLPREGLMFQRRFEKYLYIPMFYLS